MGKDRMQGVKCMEWLQALLCIIMELDYVKSYGQIPEIFHFIQIRVKKKQWFDASILFNHIYCFYILNMKTNFTLKKN